MITINCLRPSCGYTDAAVRGAIALTGTLISEPAVGTWTENERALAYDWAARELIVARGQCTDRTPQPGFVRLAGNESLSHVKEMKAALRYFVIPGGEVSRCLLQSIQGKISENTAGTLVSLGLASWYQIPEKPGGRWAIQLTAEGSILALMVGESR